MCLISINEKGEYNKVESVVEGTQLHNYKQRLTHIIGICLEVNNFDQMLKLARTT